MTEQNASGHICVIMAGGSGERFWPLSRRLHPKQLLRLTHPERNLLETTVDRIAPLIAPEHTFIATSRLLQDPIRRGGAGVPDENVLAEPCKRNTAGCLAWVVAEIQARYGEDAGDMTMAILSADHLVPDGERFRETISVAMEAARKEDALVVLGVSPNRPETGFGYIEVGEGVEPINPGSGTAVYPVAAFREKPDAEAAAEFLCTGRFYWNSGMFFWTVSRFLLEIEEASPAHAAAIRVLTRCLQDEDLEQAERIFESLANISIDYALMEKAGKVLMARADFEWDDIGSWDALDRTREHDSDGNVAVGEPVLVDARDCIVYNEPGAKEMAVGVIGVEGLAIIVSRDGILVIPKERAQEVRLVVEELKKKQAKQL
ncbi:mannose-1-phosphate guanylyltransferase [bacterium]|nr:mannose-1-phosphate guanylyltransferase [bacterium]